MTVVKRESGQLTRIGKTTEVGVGQMHVFDVSGTRVNVASVQGQLYAIDDSCTHTGCSLARGRLDGTTVTCPCHGSQFDVTSGAVLRGPAHRPVRSRRLRIDGEQILVEA
jgi:nitrite reductase/ring-hydroxylating ferredoxin subunit